MDIMLERILTLIPKKENGAFKHGALSQFARSLGFKDGHIVSDWIAGNSESYKNYLYQIAAKYDVTVEWLRGETDEKSEGEKNKRSEESEALVSELPDDIQKLILICKESPALAAALLAVAQQIETGQSAQGKTP